MVHKPPGSPGPVESTLIVQCTLTYSQTVHNSAPHETFYHIGSDDRSPKSMGEGADSSIKRLVESPTTPCWISWLFLSSLIEAIFPIDYLAHGHDKWKWTTNFKIGTHHVKVDFTVRGARFFVHCLDSSLLMNCQKDVLRLERFSVVTAMLSLSPYHISMGGYRPWGCLSS